MALRSYHRYPTGLKIQYAERSLSKNTLRQIPRSTRHRWRQLSVNDFWIPDAQQIYDHENVDILKLLAQNQKLKQQLRSLCYLLSVYRSLLRQFKPQLKQIRGIRKHVDILLMYSEQIMPGNKLWKRMPFSVQQWHAASRPHCRISLLQLCRKENPHQLTLAEQEVILRECRNNTPQAWSLRSIYARLVHEDQLQCSISTFYKYCRLLDITRKVEKKKKVYSSIKAGKVFEILHMDVTIFRTKDGAKNYIYSIVDNFSKGLLACAAASTCCSQFAKELLEQTLSKYGLLHKSGTLITDDGSENKGAVDQWLSRPGMLWKKVIAQLDIIQSNSMVEANHKIVKYRYLYKREIDNLTSLQKELQLVRIAQLNTPLLDLCGLTPLEVINGAIPDIVAFKRKIANGRKARLKINQQIVCNNTC